MGLPICARLVEKGFSVVATDRRAEARPAVLDSGAQWVDALIGLGGCRAVITVLPGPAELANIRDALLAVLAPGSTWIDMTSATPAIAGEITAAASRRGVRTLDAPIGGGPRQAREGDLLTFVGGRLSDIEEQREILDALATRVISVGAAGSGYAVKLLINLLWFGQAVASAEVLALSVRAGLDPETVRSAVQQSAAATRFMDHDAPILMRGDNLTSFSLARCVEELSGVLALGSELGVPMALGQRIAELYASALEHYGSVDGELLAARHVAEQANVVFTQRVFDRAAGSDDS
jgi:3-hydroxyisobutyrate dehydrogenase